MTPNPQTKHADKVGHSILRLQAFHGLGRALAAKPKLLSGETEPQWRRRLSAEHGFSGSHAETARRALRLVSSEGFSTSDIRGLITMSRQHQCENLFFIVWAAMAAPPRSRLALAKRAIQQGWSSRELQRQVTGRFGRRNQLGRLRHIGEGRARLLEQLDGAVNAWLRMAGQLDQPLPGDDAEQSLVESTSPAIARQFRDVRRQMLRLKGSISIQLKKPKN